MIIDTRDLKGTIEKIQRLEDKSKKVEIDNRQLVDENDRITKLYNHLKKKHNIKDD